MRSAYLNNRVLIQSKTLLRDSFGQSIPTWTDFANLWANVLFQNGKEFNASNKEIAQTLASVRIRYRLDITTQMRVVFRGINYNIKAVLPDNGHEYVDLAVEAGLNNE